jgi:hypothetical protein
MDSCAGAVVVAPVIAVTDAATGAPICDARVVATCGDGGVTLVVFGPKGYEVDGAALRGCHYGPGIERVCEIATLTVSKAGYATATVPGVEVRHSATCPGPPPDAQAVSVALERAP